MRAVLSDKIFDTIVIGAGPAGSVAAANLLKLGHSVVVIEKSHFCLLYTSPSPRDRQKSRMPSSA